MSNKYPDPQYVPYRPDRLALKESQDRAEEFYRTLDGRRSVRFFSPDPVPRSLVETIIATASTAPSGAHKQPWTFVAVGDPDLKRRIREAAEKEEKINYETRMSEEWKRDLAPLGTDFVKEYLTVVPWILVVFEQTHALKPDGSKGKHYYVKESMGIAVGMLIAAATMAGLATLVHTPSPMAFLNEALDRPPNEKAFAVIPLGYPAKDCKVPDLQRKELEDILIVRD